MKPWEPWEETWNIVEVPRFVDDWPQEWSVESEHVPVVNMSDKAHAKLASAAPDMARVLLAIEWAGEAPCNSMGCTYPACPACQGFAPAVSGFDAFNKGEAAEANRAWLGHRPACALDAALRKAGVR